MSAHTLHRLRAIFQSHERRAAKSISGIPHKKLHQQWVKWGSVNWGVHYSGLTWVHYSGLTGGSVKYLSCPDQAHLNPRATQNFFFCIAELNLCCLAFQSQPPAKTKFSWASSFSVTLSRFFCLVLLLQNYNSSEPLLIYHF